MILLSSLLSLKYNHLIWYFTTLWPGMIKFLMFVWTQTVTWPFGSSLIKFLDVCLHSDCDLTIWFKFDKVSQCLFELRLWLDLLVQVWWGFAIVWTQIIAYNKYHCKRLCVKNNFYFKRISLVKILPGKNPPQGLKIEVRKKSTSSSTFKGNYRVCTLCQSERCFSRRCLGSVLQNRAMHVVRSGQEHLIG